MDNPLTGRLWASKIEHVAMLALGWKIEFKFFAIETECGVFA
jgi:hypothetical protein